VPQDVPAAPLVMAEDSMLSLPLPKWLRDRIAYAAMSALLAWHTIAMVVATAPESSITMAARTVFQPYLTLFRLDNNWGFFAPNVPRGWQFRYVIEDSTGAKHTFIPEDKLNQLHPNSIWFKDRYKEVMRSPDLYGDAVAQEICREHADLRPVSVMLLEVDQHDFRPEDRLEDKSPFDEEFLDINTLRTVQCPSP
jgi:hypothetical protein